MIMTDHDNETYLLLTTPYNDGPREVDAGKSATFVVYFDGKPDPTVDWYREADETPIEASSKYVVHRSWGKTYLKVRDATASDNGVYRLVATTPYHRKDVNFTLLVSEGK